LSRPQPTNLGSGNQTGAIRGIDELQISAAVLAMSWCGIVFAKVRVDHGQPLSGRVSSTDENKPATSSDRPQAARVALIGLGILYVCLLIWTWRFVSQPMGTAAMSSVLHGVNLVFHEAGHVLFLPVGTFRRRDARATALSSPGCGPPEVE
jgi:hypothetical protein